MARVLENLEVVEKDSQKIFRCFRCSYELGLASKGYRKYALKIRSPLRALQPGFLAPNTKTFFLRGYCCPKCGVMFEIETTAKGEDVFESIILF